MKRMRVLLGTTALLLLGIVLWRSILLPKATAVSVYTVQNRTVEETVRCTGTVDTAKTVEVYTAVASRAVQVLAKPGQTVQEGDVLVTVDVEATVAAAIASGVQPAAVAEVQPALTAPVGGVVTSVGVTEGGMTTPQRPCVTIASRDELQLNIRIGESALRRVAVGQRVYIGGDAFTKERYTGTLTYIAAAARTEAGLGSAETAVDAVVTFDAGQADESLRLGLTAKADVVVNELTAVQVVPYECVEQDENGREYVYVVREQYAEKQEIVTAAELGDGFAVTSGLKEGDRVVTAPEAIRRDRQAVTVEETT